MSIKITALNRRNEPYDLNFANINEEIFFFYTPDPPLTPVNLTGEERWVWDFDNQNTSGMASDQVIQEIIGFDDPLGVVFTRPGINRNVTLKVWDDFSTAGTSFLLFDDNVQFPVFEFPTEIKGPEFISLNGTGNYIIDNIFDAEKYEWFVNGQLTGSNAPTLALLFDTIVKATIKVFVTNGTIKQELDFVTVLAVGNAVFGEKYEGNVKDNLLFFNKEGDNLNFEMLEDETGQSYWDGEMIFHSNSSDTFKTIGLYTLEKVDPIRFKSDLLNLRKLQLFNEFGMDFHPSYSDEILIDSVQIVNNQTEFYTKWLNGNNIHLKIPVGSEVILEDFYHIEIDNSIPDNPILTTQELITDLSSDSTSGGIDVFSVISNRRDGIMVITNTENPSYDRNYGYGEFRLANNTIVDVPQGKVTSLNMIKVIDSHLYDTEWNEPQYKLQLYDKKKLTVINSRLNDGVYTVNYLEDDKSNALNDKTFKINCIKVHDLIPNPIYGFRIKLDFKTSKILLSTSAVDFLPASQNAFLNNKNILIWESTLGRDFTPPLIKADRTFFFEQISPTHPNLDDIYDVTSVDIAGNLLTAQTTDEDGWKLTLKDHYLLDGLVLDFLVNGITTYTLTEGVEWSKGITLEESATNLKEYLLENIIGISILNVEDEVWFWEKQGYVIELTTVINTTIISWQSGVLLENNPTYGVVGDQWVLLNNSVYNGYIHHRIDQGNFHVLYFEGLFPNETQTWYPLPLDKKIVHVNPTNNIEYIQNLIADCYLEDTTLFFEQPGDTKDPDIISEQLIERFIGNNQAAFTSYGLDSYVDSGTNFCLSRLYTLESTADKDDYITVTFQQPKEVVYGTNSTDGTPDYISIASMTNTQNIEMFNVLEDLSEEFNHNFGIYERPQTITEIYERKIIINDIDAIAGLNITINGIDYPVPYDNISIIGSTTEEDLILDIEETLLDWGNQQFKQNQDIATPGDDSDIGKKYHVVLEEQGILTWLEKSGNAVALGEDRFDTLVIQSKFPNVNITYDVNGTLDMHKILHSDVEFFEIGQILTVTINNIPYSLPFQSTIDNTLSTWIDTYSETLARLDIVTEFFEGDNGTSGSAGTGGAAFSIEETGILRFSTIEENTQFNMQIWVGKTPILGRDLYKIENYRKGNDGIILSGNEVIVTGVDLQTLGFSTAMIIALTNSVFALNNQEYNLLFVDPNILGLSYQGPFWNNDDFIGYNYLRSDFSFDFYDDAGTPDKLAFLTQSVLLSHNVEDLMHNSNPKHQIAIGGDTFSVIDGTSGTVISSTSGFDDITQVKWNPYASISGAGLMNLDFTGNIAHVFKSSDLSFEASYDLPSIVGSGAILTDVEFLKIGAYLFIDKSNSRIYLHNPNTNTLEIDFDMGGFFDPTSIILANVLGGLSNSVAVNCELTSELRFYDVEDALNGTSGGFNITFDTTINIPFTPRRAIAAQYYVWTDINNVNDKYIIVIGDTEIAYIDRVNKTLIATTLFPNTVIDVKFGYKNDDLSYLYVLTLGVAYEIEISSQIVKNSYADANTYTSLVYNGEFDVLFLTDTLNDRVASVDTDTFKFMSYIPTGISPSLMINNAYVDGGGTGDNDKIYVKNSDQTVTIISKDETYIPGASSSSGLGGESGTNASLDALTLSSREFLRYPRERLDLEDPIQFKFSWEEQGDEFESMFYYDFSGDQLDEKFRDEGIYQYTGPKPLINEDDIAFLNKEANRDLESVSVPKVQQTIFDNLFYELLLIDSETEIDPTPFPMQTFIGYNSDCEGVDTRTMLIHRLENIELVITTHLKDENQLELGWLDILNFSNEANEITLQNSNINFVESGFKKGQRINLVGRDIINEKNEATFKNAGFRGEILNVTVNKIEVKSLNKELKTESSLTTSRNLLPPFSQRPAAFEIKISVEPGLIAKINLKGQTEIEDERFRITLDNFGKNIKHSDTFIFDGYDIKENGIDWVFLNEKRKEMLIVYPEIYNFLGSYKAVINAINYFGHNELEFYEYYLNVNEDSLHYNKFHKIEIPDIFNNRVDGFTPNDFILNSLPNESYEKTNLFNLTYRITDQEGNNILAYSLEEVITKLLGLKKWLQENVIPIGNRIQDLTGRAEALAPMTLWHDVKKSIKMVFREELTVINFKVDAYLQPIENNSRTYNMHVEFFTNSEENIPDYFQLKIMTFSAKPDYTEPDFKLRSVQIINMYKTDFEPYNFTADTTTDPFILVEVISDNGRGANWTERKTFSLEERAFID